MTSIAGFLGASLSQHLLFAQQPHAPSSVVEDESENADTIAFSGPGMFTRAVADALAEELRSTSASEDGGDDDDAPDGERQPPTLVVLPPHVFYPIPNNEPCFGDPERYTRLFARHVRPDTIAVHQWACSWQR